MFVNSLLLAQPCITMGQLFFLLLKLGGFALWMNCHCLQDKPTGEDRLSQLPDDVLISILTRLNPKDAARTTLLSTRWRHLFALYAASISSLRVRCQDMFGFGHLDGFHSDYRYYPQKYLEAATQLLRLYPCRKVARLDMDFCLGPHFSSEFAQVFRHYVSGLGVERLYLYFRCGFPSLEPDLGPKEPNNWFKFSLELLSQALSLEHLQLYHCIVQPSSQLRLNSLRSIALDTVPLASGQLEGIFSSCLNLEFLDVSGCKLPDKLRIFGSVIYACFNHCGGLREIDLQATNLRTLECHFFSEVRFHFSSVPMLNNVMIYLGGDTSMRYVFGDFARDLPAQSLAVKVHVSQVDNFPVRMQMFRNLLKLTLELVEPDNSTIVKILPILGACPLLQFLNVVHHMSRRHVGGSVSAPLFSLCHTKLKKVVLGGFLGTKGEIEFAIYILRSAMVLEQLFLSSHYRFYYGCCQWGKYQTHPLYERERIKIEKELYGEAVSSNVVVRIQ